MAKTTNAAKLADLNDPAPVPPSDDSTTPRDHRTVTPTPDVARDDDADDEGVIETARKTAAAKAEAATEAVSATARDHAERVREAGQSFDPGSFAHAATERLAENLNDAANSLRETDLAQLGDSVASFARRQPLLFFGGAALLGFAAGRMMKASERAEYDTDHDDRFERSVS